MWLQRHYWLDLQPAISSQAAAWTGTETHRDLGYVLDFERRDSLNNCDFWVKPRDGGIYQGPGLAEPCYTLSVAQMFFVYGVSKNTQRLEREVAKGISDA